jgi:hypothetical protein
MGEALDNYLEDMERADFYNSHELPGLRSVSQINQTKKETMRSMSQATSVVTGEVRLSYVNLFQPRAAQQGGEPKYSVTILLPKSDTATYNRIQAAIQAAYEKGVVEKWNGARPPLKTTIHDGDGVRPSGEEFGPECKGHWVFTASSKEKPEIVDANLNPIIDQSKVYSGVYGRVHINFFAYNRSGNRGVAAGLGPVQILRDGEPLGGRVTAADVFGAAPASAAPPAYSQPGAYVPPAPPQGYGQPAAPQPPAYGQQPAPQVPQQIDPITGQPLGGGIYGI